MLVMPFSRGLLIGTPMSISSSIDRIGHARNAGMEDSAPLRTHGDWKYQSSEMLGSAAEWGTLRVEHRQISPGAQNCVRPECTELVYILSGQASVSRTGNGQTQEGLAMHGKSFLVKSCKH
jgi:hypothetical protein